MCMAGHVSQYVAVCCSVLLQDVAVCYSAVYVDCMSCVAVYCRVLQCAAVCSGWCSVLQVAPRCVCVGQVMCCSMFQCVAVCCCRTHTHIHSPRKAHPPSSLCTLSLSARSLLKHCYERFDKYIYIYIHTHTHA